jgi:hypothetical protein
MLCSVRVIQAQDVSGQWKIVKTTAQLFSQADGKLLEEQTFTTDKEMREINGPVPVSIAFTGQQYTLSFQAGTERGSYRISGNDQLQFQKETPQQPSNTEPLLPGITYGYRLKNSGLELDLPASFYKDNKRNLAVKLVYTCYYSKQ